MLNVLFKQQTRSRKRAYRGNINRMFGFLAAIAVVGLTGVAHAQKKTKTGKTRSAQGTTKTSKPSWINHYLPEDRGKILGGVWKFVSTEDDEYYYRPSSSAMLEQPAGRVIGFASAADAEEAGYLPATDVSQNDRLSVLQREIEILEATPFPPKPDKTEREAKELIGLVARADSSDYPILKAKIARWANSSSQRSEDRFGVVVALNDAMRNANWSPTAAGISLGVANYYATNRNPTYVKVDREKAKTDYTKPR
jgi:hypothetical protein